MRMAELNASRNEAVSYNLKLTLKCLIDLKLLKLVSSEEGRNGFTLSKISERLQLCRHSEMT